MSERPFAFGAEAGYTALGNDPKYANRVPLLNQFGLLDSSLFQVSTGELSGGLLTAQGYYFVDVVNGNDTLGDGSISLPFQTINKALAADTLVGGLNTTVHISLVGVPGTSYAAATVTNNRHSTIVLRTTAGTPAEVASVTFTNAPVSSNASLHVIGVVVTATSHTNNAVNFSVDCRDGGWVNTASSTNASNTGSFYSYGVQAPALTNIPFVAFADAALSSFTPSTPLDWSTVPETIGEALDTVAADLLERMNVATNAVLTNELAAFTDASGKNVKSTGILSTALYTAIGQAGGGTSLLHVNAAPTLTFKTLATNLDTAFTITDAGGLLTLNLLQGNIDHGTIAGLADDDHTMYMHNSLARTVTAVHTFNPSVAGPAFILGANAVNQLVAGLNAAKLNGNVAGDAVWNAGFADGIEIDNTGITDGQYMAYSLAQTKFLPVSPLNPSTAQFNANKILNKTVSDSAIGDGKVLAYNLGSNQIEYVAQVNPNLAQFNANKIQGKTVDITDIGDTKVLSYNLGSDQIVYRDIPLETSASFNANKIQGKTVNAAAIGDTKFLAYNLGLDELEYVDQLDVTVAQFNANKIQGKTVNAAAIGDTKVLSYDLGTDELIYRSIPLETSASFNANKIQGKTVNAAAIGDTKVLSYDLGTDQIVYASAVIDTTTIVAERRYMIVSLDLKSNSDTTVLTVPVGKNMVIDAIQVLITSASGVTVIPTVSAGIIGDLDKYVAAVALGGGANTVGYREDLTLVTLERVAAGQSLTFSITAFGAASGAYTATVMFRGVIL